jgi:hypothetical protein
LSFHLLTVLALHKKHIADMAKNTARSSRAECVVDVTLFQKAATDSEQTEFDTVNNGGLTSHLSRHRAKENASELDRPNHIK